MVYIIIAIIFLSLMFIALVSSINKKQDGWIMFFLTMSIFWLGNLIHSIRNYTTEDKFKPKYELQFESEKQNKILIKNMETQDVYEVHNDSLMIFLENNKQ